MKFFNNFKRHFIVVSILYLLFGLVLFFWPTTSIKVIFYAFGFTTLIYGIVHIIGYLTNDFGSGFLRLNLITGVICTLLGIFLLLKPVTILSLLPIILGLFLVFNSVVKLQNVFELKRCGYSNWWSVLLLAIVTSVFGLVLLIFPFAAASTLVRFVGASFVLDGAVNIWSTFCIEWKI